MADNPRASVSNSFAGLRAMPIACCPLSGGLGKREGGNALPETRKGQGMRKIDELKAKGEYFEAGKEAFKAGRDMVYGCHFGMRSNCMSARLTFEAGWKDAKAEAKTEAKANG